MPGLPFALLLALMAAMPARAQLDASQMAAAVEKAQPCFACHGPQGNSQNPEYPILAGQTWRYIYIELKDFKEGRRKDEQMSPMGSTSPITVNDPAPPSTSTLGLAPFLM